MKKRIISALLALAMLLSIHTTAFAVNASTLPSPTADTLVEARGNFGGYGHRVTGSGSGTFDVVVTASTLSAGITMSTECSNPNAWVSF